MEKRLAELEERVAKLEAAAGTTAVDVNKVIQQLKLKMAQHIIPKNPRNRSLQR